MWAAVRAVGPEVGYPWSAALAFTPYVAALSWLPVLVSVMARRRAAVAVGLLAAAVLVGSVAPRAVADRGATDPGGPTLRLLTANLYFGRADLEEVVALAVAEDVDVLAVQELDAPSARRLEQLGLTAHLPHHHLRTADGGRGQGIWSRVPLRARGEVDPGGATRQPVALLDVAGAPPVEVVSVHPLPPSSPRHVLEWRRGLAALPSAGSGAVRLLAGDFNATLDHIELRRVLGRGYVDAGAHLGKGLRTTWPTGRILPPGVTLDRVLVDRRATPIGTRTLHLPGSDHRGVLVDVRLPAG